MMTNSTTINKLFTIGVYGFDVETFFRSLQDYQIDTFVDIRRRRGVRGSQYAFANSQRLQAALEKLGIRYIYGQELAPTEAVRDQQRLADASTKTAKRDRDRLSPGFVTAYETQILGPFDIGAFCDRLPADTGAMVLFCVERTPAACHRSLAAERLAAELGVPLVHILPPDSPTDP